jgi:hypothetical protein
MRVSGKAGALLRQALSPVFLCPCTDVSAMLDDLFFLVQSPSSCRTPIELTAPLPFLALMSQHHGYPLHGYQHHPRHIRISQPYIRAQRYPVPPVPTNCKTLYTGV